jgi:hypothetical protein
MFSDATVDCTVPLVMVTPSGVVAVILPLSTPFWRRMRSTPVCAEALETAKASSTVGRYTR